MREIVALVEHYLREWDSSGWAGAYHSLIELGPPALPELEKQLASSRDPRFRAALVELARHVHTEDALPLFEAALRDPSPEVWKAALDGLVDLASPASLLLLQEAVEREPPVGTASSEWQDWVREALQQARATSAHRPPPPRGCMMAEQKPDFSGEWILNRQACTLSPGADAVQSGTVRIEHHDPTFRYQATLVSESGPLQYEYELPSDGREVVGTRQGVTTVSSLRWEGEALVATWRIQGPDGEMKISFRHDLLDAGQRLRAVERLRGSAHSQDNVWMFERR